ncbi:MAG: hypothetical protein R3240_09565, partial [Gammaproteobacteria bacterium]|nr:hypothetical protein [Gammaproteobacteria bacterium]
MDKNAADEPGKTIYRGGEKISLQKVPDHIAVRLKRGNRHQDISASFGVAHDTTFYRQKIASFKVEADRCDAVMDEMRQGSETEFASHVYTMTDNPAEKIIFSDEITVQ